MQRQQVGSHRELQSEQVPLRQLLGFFVWGGEQDTWVSRMNLFFFPFFLLCFHPSHLQINKEKRKNSLLDRQTDRLNLTYPWRKKEKFADANIFRPFCFFSSFPSPLLFLSSSENCRRPRFKSPILLYCICCCTSTKGCGWWLAS